MTPSPSAHDLPRPITLGVLLDGTLQERWVLESLRQAVAVPGVSVVALAVATTNSRVSLASRLHRLFDQLDKQLRCRNERLFVSTDITAELALPMLEVKVDQHSDGWYPHEAGVSALRRPEVDLWLCFTAVPPRRPLPCCSRLGVWGIEIGQGLSAASIWAGAMEVCADSPVTAVSVVDYAEAENGLLYQSFGATIKNSVRRNRLNALRKAVSFFRRMLAVRTRNEVGRLSLRPATIGMPTNYASLPAPVASALVRLLWRLVSNVAANQLKSLRWLDQWQIAYYFADENDVGHRFEQLRYLVPPMDRFWADPFALEFQGRYYIFFEELPYDTQKGHIAVVEVFDNGAPAKPTVVLERPYHLSYPFLFEWEGSLYMLPETAQNRTVELYRCEEFPQRWHLHQVLLEDICAFDATLWRQDDRWWMFVSVAAPDADNGDELHLFWSKTPFGPWAAHRGNPVISDVRYARPAGPLFSRGGKLYRPSQDCSLSYGHSVVVSRVEALGEDDYHESPVERLAPGWKQNILRVHTFGGEKRLRVIDTMVRRKRR